MTGKDDAEIMARWNAMKAEYTNRTAIDLKNMRRVWVPVAVDKKDDAGSGKTQGFGASKPG